MVRALEQEQENYRSRLFHFRGMYENAGGHAKSMSVDSGSALDGVDDDDNDRVATRSQGSISLNDQPLERQNIVSIFKKNDQPPISRLTRDEAAGAKDKHISPSSGNSPLFLFFFISFNYKENKTICVNHSYIMHPHKVDIYIYIYIYMPKLC
jgi:hypothetical protein